jgi:hypothetical protein
MKENFFPLMNWSIARLYWSTFVNSYSIIIEIKSCMVELPSLNLASKQPFTNHTYITGSLEGVKYRRPFGMMMILISMVGCLVHGCVGARERHLISVLSCYATSLLVEWNCKLISFFCILATLMVIPFTIYIFFKLYHYFMSTVGNC